MRIHVFALDGVFDTGLATVQDVFTQITGRRLDVRQQAVGVQQRGQRQHRRTAAETGIVFDLVGTDFVPDDDDDAEGGQIRHIFFDTGHDQLMAFMEPQGVPGIPADYDAGINAGLGVPGSFYHFAFEAGTEAGLEAKRQELLAKGVAVSDVVDHDWAKSIYFKDPNGMQMEFCCFTREFGSEDAVMTQRFEASIKALGLEETQSLVSTNPPQ